MYDYQMMDGYSYNSGWGWIMMVFWVILIIIVVFVAVRLLKDHDHHAVYAHKGDAMDIVKERYAKGEIDKEQFEQIKKDLNK